MLMSFSSSVLGVDVENLILLNGCFFLALLRALGFYVPPSPNQKQKNTREETRNKKKCRKQNVLQVRAAARRESKHTQDGKKQTRRTQRPKTKRFRFAGFAGVAARASPGGEHATLSLHGGADGRRAELRGGGAGHAGSGLDCAGMVWYIVIVAFFSFLLLFRVLTQTRSSISLVFC